MRRRTMVAALAALLAGATAVPSAAAGTPTALVLPGDVAFALLGHWCGGITQQDYATGFDPATGWADGVTHLSTTCSTGGRGSPPATFEVWTSAVWDLTATLVSAAALPAPPPIDPTLNVTDAHGNQLANAGGTATLTLAPGFVPPPRVGAVSPAVAPQGTTVTISGDGFGGATAVSFGSVPAAFTVTSPTSLLAVVPAVTSGTVDVVVTGPGGASPAVAADRFTFDQAPRVGALAPSSGTPDGGTRVVITGSDLLGARSVRFGGVRGRFKVISDTEIVATSPAVPDPTAVDVTVVGPHGTSATSAADVFTYR